VNSPAEYFKLIFDDKKEISSVNFLNDDTAEVKFRDAGGFEKLSTNTNVAIAAFTTTHARLKLYECMERAGTENIHYCDTYSIIYSYKKDESPIKLDNELGGLTDELDGNYITELVCLAPKTYTYLKNDGSFEMRAKGFSINKDAEDTINFDSMKEMVIELKDNGGNQDEG